MKPRNLFVAGMTLIGLFSASLFSQGGGCEQACQCYSGCHGFITAGIHALKGQDECSRRAGETGLGAARQIHCDAQSSQRYAQ